MEAGLTDFRQRWRSRFYWPFAGGGGGTPEVTNPEIDSETGDPVIDSETGDPVIDRE